MNKQALTKEEFVQKVQQAKRAMANRCQQIAVKYTPPDYQVFYRKSLSGYACQEEKTIHAPKPTTRKSLYIYLHECAHVALNHNSRKPRHVEEMEAEKWAQETMRREGIPVPRSMIRTGKLYVARKIDQALRRGAKKIDGEARRYAKSVKKYFSKRGEFMSKANVESINGVDCIVGHGMTKGNLGSVKVTNRQRVQPQPGVTVLYRIDGNGGHYPSPEFIEWFKNSDHDNLDDDGCIMDFEQYMVGEGWIVEEYSPPHSRGLVVLGKPKA